MSNHEIVGSPAGSPSYLVQDAASPSQSEMEVESPMPSGLDDDSPSPGVGLTKSPKPTLALKAVRPNSKNRRASATDTVLGGAKVTKRRAARACISCRARKVRCDVVEGAPCGNCRWDEVPCEVQESRRRKKHHFPPRPAMVGSSLMVAEALSARTPNPISITSADLASRDGSGIRTPFPVRLSQTSNIFPQNHGFLPGPLPQLPNFGAGNGSGLLASPSLGRSMGQFLGPTALDEGNLLPRPLALPRFIESLPNKLLAEDAKYLAQKGAVALPPPQLQAALLKAYVEYVHPYMPLIELNEFLNAINCADGSEGQVSLFLYQAVMFVAAAFVDIGALRDAGFLSRKNARKAFFTKTRLLYDFDCEPDRLVLVQALLLMTYWYETPDDQKDTWHWMGVAISLAHTIGLHRNPARTSLTPQKQSLWKRIWWSCFMRDRLVALGMRRPTRIKDEDFDVPMLTLDDFEIKSLPDNNQLLGPDCAVARDTETQKQLALMCIEKAKLTIIISHMLKVQYSVLSRDGIRPEATTGSTMMLFPNKTLDNLGGVQEVDAELANWYNNLPACCQRQDVTKQEVEEGRSTLAVHRHLLHMIYYTTISALHRPQYLPPSPEHAQTATMMSQEVARTRVRKAAEQITQMAEQLHQFQLEKFLPTTGVTVLLPACIIHLLDMRTPEPMATRALEGFRACMQVMEKLQEQYAAADFALGFLNAAHKKSSTGAVPLYQPQPQPEPQSQQQHQQQQNYFLQHQQHQQQQQQQQYQHHQQHQHHHSQHELVLHRQQQQQRQQQHQQQQQLTLQQRHHQPQRAQGKALATGINPSPGAADSHPATPPPENAPYMNTTEASLYHQNRAFVATDTDSNPLMHRQSTPHSDQDQGTGSEMDDGSASGTMSPYANEQAMFDGASMDARPDEAAALWGSMAPVDNIDFSQWLQFPAEGLNNSDEVFISYGSGGTDKTGNLGNHSMDWLDPQQQTQQQQQYHGGAMGDLGAIDHPLQ
ncbi:cutinase transcription factor 1 beta [Cercophora scortea]|uniref:Cutinase transcription factor 1 beta n=1 Tax=Cercophora scortea TaxID=314031 RepID=A0AAE0ILJ5_9PEZI|nr:cutinase transcription factor 1 beta [Cercophora scortea]